MLWCSERGLSKERHFGALLERPRSELNVLLWIRAGNNEWVDTVGSSAQKWPHESPSMEHWVQMVQPGQQEQLWEGTPGRPSSATSWSSSAPNQQQKGHTRRVLAFKPLKMQQSSEVAQKQQQAAWGASGLAQLCTTCPPRIRFLEFPSLCSNFRPTYVTSCSLSALFMDPS